MLLLSLLATSYAISAALRLRSQEYAGRAEPHLATSITRRHRASGHLAVAMGAGGAIVVDSAVCVGVVAAIQREQTSWVTDMLSLGLAYVPAMWLIVAIVVALCGSDAGPVHRPGWIRVGIDMKGASEA